MLHIFKLKFFISDINSFYIFFIISKFQIIIPICVLALNPEKNLNKSGI